MKPVTISREFPQPMNESWQEWVDSLTLSQAETLRQCLETNPYRALLSPITVWRLITGNGVVVTESQAETIIDRVRAVIAKMPEPFNAKQVNARVPDLKCRSVVKTMFDLFQNGELKRVGKKYAYSGFSYCRAGTEWARNAAQDNRRDIANHQNDNCAGGTSESPARNAQYP